MSENNFEDKEVLEEQLIDEEAVEETEVLEEVEISDSKGSFIKSLCAVITDEAIIGIVSIILLYIFEGLLKINGYFVTQKISFTFILFVLVSIIYNSVMENIKDGKTVGKKLFNL